MKPNTAADDISMSVLNPNAAATANAEMCERTYTFVRDANDVEAQQLQPQQQKRGWWLASRQVLMPLVLLASFSFTYVWCVATIERAYEDHARVKPVVAVPYQAPRQPSKMQPYQAPDQQQPPKVMSTVATTTTAATTIATHRRPRCCLDAWLAADAHSFTRNHEERNRAPDQRRYW